MSTYTSLEQVAEHAASKALVGGQVYLFGPTRGTKRIFDEIMRNLTAVLSDHEFEYNGPQMGSPQIVRLANGGRVFSTHRESNLLGRPIDLLIQLSPTRRGQVVEGLGGEVFDVRMVMSRNS